MNDIMTETTIQKTSSAAIVPLDEDKNFELSARNPAEMVQCHQAAIGWCERKIQSIKAEAGELEKAYLHAKAKKWANETLKRHWGLTLKRVVFYEKMLAAFNAGYYIVPNFPVTLFAIKTTKPTPKRMWARLRSENRKNFQQHPEVLPAGEGEYQNPNPIVTKSYSSFLSDQQKGDTWAFEATEWDEMEFPANMARVHVMEAATRAMDEKIFDEVAFLPQDHKRNPDPLLIGRIIDPRPAAYYGGQRRVSFMLAWHIDTRTL